MASNRPEMQCIVVIGSSASGPRILREIFTEMPKLNMSIVLVQHMPQFIENMFVKSIGQLTPMIVKIAEDGDPLNHGSVYVAPSGVHLQFDRNRFIRLVKGESVNQVCPSVDVAMLSLVPQPGVVFAGIVLSGMGNDGAQGMVHLKRLNGITIVQDENTSAIFEMPRQTLLTGCVDHVLPPNEIRRRLIELGRMRDVP